MVVKCANRSCCTVSAQNEGKLFRLDIDIGNVAGQNQVKTTYVWLCDHCAGLLSPRVEVSGDAVLVRLGAVYHGPAQAGAVSPPRVN